VAITAAELSKALACYTHNEVYLRSMKAGADRFDLDGKLAGAVDREQAWHAAVCWAGIARKKSQAKLDRGRKFLT
jgi:sRNA-binding protein